MQLDRQALLEWQQSFADRIYLQPSGEMQLQSGLQIYRNNLLMTAVRTLSITYPVLVKMVGQEMLIPLAARLLRRERPSTGDWADWGGGLFHLLEHSELHADFPLLAEMARFEWLRHQVSRAPEVQFSLASLDKMKRRSLDRIRILPSPSLTLMQSPYPIDRIWQLHRAHEPDHPPDSHELANVLNNSMPVHLLLFQQHQQPRQQRLTIQEYNWMVSVVNGDSIGSLVDRYTEFDFIHWLPRAIGRGWITALATL